MISFETVSSEVFQIIRSFNYTVKMYDDEAKQVYEPEESRRFFILPKNMLLSIVDDGEEYSGIRLYLSKSTKAKDIKKFIDTLRTTATKYKMIWHISEKDTELKTSDFATKSSVTESRETQMNIFEGMYGTSRSSYLTLENAKLIVRHTESINENSIGARSRKIKKIFIENAQGERMLFPTRQLIPARAELQHVNQGGNFNDAISQQIMRMANDFSNLSVASTEIASAAPMLGESAMSIREACRSKMTEMKKCFERLSRPLGYKMESKKMKDIVLTENEDQSLDISPLKEVLTCEGFELSESILKSVAEAVKSVAEALTAGTPVKRDGQSEEDYLASLEEPTYLRREKAAKAAQDALGGGPKLRTAKDEPSDIKEADEDYDDEPAEKTRKGPEQVTILGKSVDKSAWEDLLSDRLDLSREPDMTIMPKFTSDEAKRSFMLSKIVPYIKNDSMLNLLSYFSDMIENPRLNPDARRKMNMVISVAIKNAKVPDETEPELVNNEVIREFSEWMEQFDVSNILSEAGMFNHHHDSIESAKNSILRRITTRHINLLSKFGPVRVMAAVEDEARNLDDLEEIGSSDVSAWVNNVIENLENGHYNHLDTNEELGVHEDKDENGKELDKIPGTFNPDGSYNTTDDEFNDFDEYDYDLDEDMDGNSLTFSHTDIIIPTNQGDDLEREVTKPSSIDPFTGQEEPVDDDYIERMRTLAGMPWNR